MRVIAGSAKGRRLRSPPREVRPTGERVREALFSSLLPRLPEARVLDLFSGSGALGIEALSRGAASATFVERSSRALRVLRDNLESTGLAADATVVEGDVRRVLAAGPRGAPFDVVLLDPPYAIPADELAEVLERLVPHLAADALVVLEADPHEPAPRWPAGVLPGRSRRYGSTVLHEGHRADVEAGSA